MKEKNTPEFETFLGKCFNTKNIWSDFIAEEIVNLILDSIKTQPHLSGIAQDLIDELDYDEDKASKILKITNSIYFENGINAWFAYLKTVFNLDDETTKKLSKACLETNLDNFNDILDENKIEKLDEESFYYLTLKVSPFLNEIILIAHEIMEMEWDLIKEFEDMFNSFSLSEIPHRLAMSFSFYYLKYKKWVLSKNEETVLSQLARNIQLFIDKK